MPLFVTTVITLGQTPTGFGVYPLTYVNETRSSLQARDSALADAMKSDPGRTIHDTATSRVPDAVVKAGVVQSVVATSAILTSQTDAGTVLTAFSHAGLGSAEAAKSAAIASAGKAHPDKTVAYVGVTTVPGDVLLRAARQVEEREKSVASARSAPPVETKDPSKEPVFDVGKFAARVINNYRDEAREMGPVRARTVVIYREGQDASENKTASRAGAIAVASSAIDTYVDGRRNGLSHVAARENASAEIARRFDDRGRERDVMPRREREQTAAL